MNSGVANPLKYSIHTRLRQYHLNKLMPRIPGGLMLDVGCGVGYLTGILGKGYKTFGVEYDTEGFKRCDKNSPVCLVRADASMLPFKKHTFDVVVCTEVLEHLPDGKDEEALREMAALLKCGGRLLITVPSLEGIRANSNLRNLGHNDPEGGEYHFRSGYSWPDFKAMLERIPDLRIVRRRYSMFLFSELFMDVLKWVFLRKNKLREHSDIVDMKDTPLFRLYRLVFPVLYFFFVVEDVLLARTFKGHILVLELARTGD